MADTEKERKGRNEYQRDENKDRRRRKGNDISTYAILVRYGPEEMKA
jgi:hypothetical protein